MNTKPKENSEHRELDAINLLRTGEIAKGVLAALEILDSDGMDRGLDDAFVWALIKAIVELPDSDDNYRVTAALITRLIELTDKLRPLFYIEDAQRLLWLGRLHRRDPLREDAEQFFLAAFCYAEHEYGSRADLTLGAATHLAIVCPIHAYAVALDRWVIAVHTEQFGSGSIRDFWPLIRLAMRFWENRTDGEAVAAYEQAVEIWEGWPQLVEPYQIEDIILSLSEIAQEAADGSASAAEAVLRRALRIAETLLADAKDGAARTTFVTMADCSPDHADATRFHERASAIANDLGEGPKPPETGASS